jgi:two-component system nitrate/nitrite response regulator NarL
MPSETSSITIVTPPRVKNVLVCDAQPVTVAGVKALISGHQELRFTDSVSSLPDALDVVRERQIDIVLVEKTFGCRAIEEFLAGLRQDGITTQALIWGAVISEAETMRFMHAGARGVLLKTTEVSSFVVCLRAIAQGRLWLDESMLRTRNGDSPSNTLTAREQQVYELVRQGFTNKQMALELQIKPGTVKIHMKHIFEKTGVRGRHTLALATMFGDANVQAQKHAAVA